MAIAAEKNETLVTNVSVKPDCMNEFIDWQKKLNAAIAKFPGFVSLEIVSLKKAPILNWSIVQRFSNVQSCSEWRVSDQYKELTKELKSYLVDNGFQEETGVGNRSGGITEVFVTQVNPEKDASYREWIAKVHQAEAKFPGFQGMYVQSPGTGNSNNWITFLNFDTPENLDRWLSSEERKKMLRELAPLITSLESHRVISPYGGWFGSLEKGDKVPVWKQSMIILLVLFPIVMLEMKFLPYLTGGLNKSLGMFIGNAISVSLLAWPMLPIAIWFLQTWLTAKPSEVLKNISGFIFICVLYMLSIILFWNLV